jgi:hypothetical protein
VYATGALLVSAASAEETLLASWLANGSEVATELNDELSTTMLFEDNKTIAGGASVTCGLVLMGTVSANGNGLITSVLNLKGEAIAGELSGLALLGEGAGTDCLRVSACSEGSAGSPIEVWPAKLPWSTLLYLKVDGKLLVSITGAAFELLCLIIGLNVVDSCEAGSTAFEVINSGDTGDAAIPSGSVASPNGSCTLGGACSGVNVTTELSPITLESGELLTVSSE